LRYTEQDPEIQIGIAIASEAQEGGSNGVVPSGKPLSKFPLSKSSAGEGATPEIAAGRINSPVRIIQSPISPSDKNPVLFSYSSSDDEQDFYDAEDFVEEEKREDSEE